MRSVRTVVAAQCGTVQRGAGAGDAEAANRGTLIEVFEPKLYTRGPEFTRGSYASKVRKTKNRPIGTANILTICLCQYGHT